MANKKITDFPDLTDINQDGLYVPIVDTNDSSMDASGTNKKLDLKDVVDNTLTSEQQATLSHFVFNPATDKLEADRAIETTLNSLFLGEQHKMSSGSENIYFTNLTSQIDWYPVWGGVKDQSILANQDMSGVYNPTGRVFSEYGVLGLGGNPVDDTSIAYDGDNFFPFNISGMGITTRIAEAIPSTTRLKYELSVNGTPVYVQFLEHNGLAINEDLSWYFDHPLDVVAGSTNHASITKIDADQNSLGLLMVCKGDDGTNRYQTNVINRLFEDKSVAFTEDLEALDVVGFYDIYVDATFSGTSTGTNLAPYTTMEAAVNASSSGDKIFVKGIINVSSEITLIHSLHFYGIDGTEVRYVSYNSANGNVFNFAGSDNTQSFTFKNISFKNAGEYGLKIVNSASVNITDCTFSNNGWSGNGLNTIIDSATSSIAGYDSDQADLQAFYAGANASNGGAMRIENSTMVRVIGNTVTNNLRGIRVQDCGIDGAGFITRNVSTQNIESGIYIAAGALGGCQNITTTINVSSYNANNGLLVIGGINNKFSQNEVSGNWNAGFCAWGAANSTLRDCGLYDNNRSEYNGIGNTGDAKASIQINEAYNLLGTTISLNSNARFIAEILDTQVHYTGLGSNTEKIGLLITGGVGNLAYNEKNIIKVDDVGFIGQDYAIDFSEVNLDNLYVSLGDNSYMNIGEKAVRPPLSGDYFELPFSNHTTKIKYADVYLDLVGNVFIDEGVGGNRLNPYKVNELEAVAYGSDIKVILKGSDKIQFVVPVAGCSIDGVLVNSVLNQALVQLNNVFTNSVGFASNDVYVSGFVLSGDDLTLSLNDGTSYTVDVTTLGVDENKFVSSGAINGSDLELTMNDSSVLTIDMSNMINGASLSATNDRWYISYGANANTEVGASTVDSVLRDQQPFYFGQTLSRGSEFKWNVNTANQQRWGIWDGSETANTFSDGVDITNWNTCFNFANGGTRFIAGSNTALTTGTEYVVSNGDVLGIKFDADGHLTLIDYSEVDPVEIAKTTIALSVTEFNLQYGAWQLQAFPNGIISTEDWTIVHDFDGDEAGIVNGIQDHTVIKSNVSIKIGEKIMFMLDEVGQGDYFGTGYSNASSGVSTAEEQLDNEFKYENNEAISFEFGGVSDWDVNTSATYYFDNGAGIVGYRKGGANAIQGMFSMRFNNDGTLTIYSEDNNENVATAKVDPTIGSSVSLYFGVTGNRAYYSIPVISKQVISQGSQPDLNAAPVVADQTVSVTEGDALSFQIVSSDNIVNQFFESNAPSWMTMNQNTGVLSGTAPAYVGSSADTIVVNCKAGNAIGGSVDFTVTVTVAEDVSYTNSNSMSFNGTSNFMQGNPINITALERATNGDGNSWTISMWVKPNSATGNQTLMVYGAGDDYNGGAITLKQSGGTTLVLNYGTVYNNIIIVAGNSFVANTWQHVMITFDGGTTGSDPLSSSDYYSRFDIYIDGVLKSNIGVASGSGYDGAITGSNPSDNIFRIGRASNVHNNYYGGVINQVAIWASDETANLATIYNSGVTQDLSLLASAPDHYYEIESSITSIPDLSGNADLTGYSFNSSSLVNDTP
jgi:parallel beta-helix repeat protein